MNSTKLQTDFRFFLILIGAEVASEPPFEVFVTPADVILRRSLMTLYNFLETALWHSSSFSSTPNTFSSNKLRTIVYLICNAVRKRRPTFSQKCENVSTTRIFRKRTVSKILEKCDMSTSTAENIELKLAVSFSKLVALQSSLPGSKDFRRIAKKLASVFSKLFNFNVFWQCNYFLLFQQPSLQSIVLLKTKLTGGRPVCLCEWVQTTNSFSTFKKYDAHLDDRQDRCNYCVQVCSPEGSSIFL